MNFLTQDINYFILFLSFLIVSEVLEVYLSIRNRACIKRNREKVKSGKEKKIYIREKYNKEKKGKRPKRKIEQYLGEKEKKT